ncbi:MAG: phosphoribosylformylglycinamidine synthase subunit PurQ [Acutalibacteraceae bacterium]
MVFRIYTEKKRGLDAEAKNLLGYIKNYISVEPETELRLFDRYDFDGLTKEEFDVLAKKAITDENTDTAFIDYLPLTTGWRSFSISPVDGVFDEKFYNLKGIARSYGINHYKCKRSKVIAVSNILNDYKFEEIKKLLLDKKFNYLSDSNKSLSLEYSDINFGETVVDDDFLEKNDIQIYQYLIKTSLKMSKEMLCIVRDYFKLLKRNPTLIELYAIDSYLASKNFPEDFKFGEINFENLTENSPLKITMEEFISLREQAGIDKTGTISLKDIAMAGYDYMKQKGQIQDIVIENNQPLIQLPVDVNGVVEQYFVSFKAGKTNKFDDIDVFPQKTFNTLEAYQSLCVDCRPYLEKQDRISSVSTFKNTTIGDEITKKTAEMNRKLGICSSLGGQIYSKGIKNPVNFSATAFSGTKSDFSSKVQSGDFIVMLGSKMTINDFSDKNFNRRTIFSMKEKINQFFKITANETFIKKSLDFSEGIIPGIISKFKGVEIDINRLVASKYIAYSHLALSIKNIRSAVIVSKENIERIKQICISLGLSSHIIGEIKEEPYLIIKNGKKQLANLSTDFIRSLHYSDNYSVLISDSSVKKIDFDEMNEEFRNLDLKSAFLNNLKDISVCSKKGISSEFDSTVGGGCVLPPFGGSNSITPSDSFICKIPTATGNTNTVTAISYGCNPKISEISPYHGAAFSIMECISKIVATGANSINTKLGICQNISDPKDFPSKYSGLFSAIFGAFATETGMNIPSISYDLSIDKANEGLLDFCCFAIAVSKANEVITADFKSAGSTIILVPMPIVQKTGLPDYDKAKVIYRQIHYLSQNGKVLSAGVVSDGGIAALVAKMSFGNNIGVDFETLDKETLFSAKTASIVIETKNPGAFSGMDTVIIGQTIAEPEFRFDSDIVSINEAMALYTGNLQSFYPTRTSKKTAMAKIDLYESGIADRIICRNKVALPKVIIPVFSSFSGANDSFRAFTNAGAQAEILCINSKDYQNSLTALSNKIDNSQIICLPSGSGSAFSSEFGYSVMTNPMISESVLKLLNRDGLIIGFEEGFDILLKSGLITSGVYKSLENGAFLTQSVIGMPSSGFVRTKIISDKSPWLSLCTTGDIHSAPVYHSKARFVADELTMLSLIKNNQVAAQYIDKNEKPAAKMPYNPDSSVCAVESLTSPDGRIFGKVSQPQRRTRGCFTNISGNKDPRIFEAGVKYFKD